MKLFLYTVILLFIKGLCCAVFQVIILHRQEETTSNRFLIYIKADYIIPKIFQDLVRQMSSHLVITVRKIEKTRLEWCETWWAWDLAKQINKYWQGLIDETFVGSAFYVFKLFSKHWRLKFSHLLQNHRTTEQLRLAGTSGDGLAQDLHQDINLPHSRLSPSWQGPGIPEGQS